MVFDNFTRLDQIIGKIAALTLFYLGIVYLVVTSIGLLSLKSSLDPISDPWFSIMEIIILVMSPLMVVLMVEVHTYASNNLKALSLVALIFMIILACITSSVHYVRLTASQESISNLPWFFSFTWPSVIYALDILAWDFFFSFSMFFAAPIFKGNKLKISVRIFMIVSGVLSFIGLLGPIAGNMQIRNIGIVGYGVVFPFVCLLLAKVFSQTEVHSKEDK